MSAHLISVTSQLRHWLGAWKRANCAVCPVPPRAPAQRQCVCLCSSFFLEMPCPFTFAVFEAHFKHRICHKAFLLDATAFMVLLWPVSHSPPDLSRRGQDFSRFSGRCSDRHSPPLLGERLSSRPRPFFSPQRGESCHRSPWRSASPHSGVTLLCWALTWNESLRSPAPLGVCLGPVLKVMVKRLPHI